MRNSSIFLILNCAQNQSGVPEHKISILVTKMIFMKSKLWSLIYREELSCTVYVWKKSHVLTLLIWEKFSNSKFTESSFGNFQNAYLIYFLLILWHNTSDVPISQQLIFSCRIETNVRQNIYQILQCVSLRVLCSFGIQIQVRYSLYHDIETLQCKHVVE